MSLPQLVGHCYMYMKLEFESWSFYIFILMMEFLDTTLLNEKNLDVN
jgi:hypothetical protein